MAFLPAEPRTTRTELIGVGFPHQEVDRLLSLGFEPEEIRILMQNTFKATGQDVVAYP